MEMHPEIRLPLDDDEPHFIGPEFELSGERELTDGVRFEHDERQRFDEQILAALVSP